MVQLIWQLVVIFWSDPSTSVSDFHMSEIHILNPRGNVKVLCNQPC